jgi:putative nucleotidyltransferase with HDIG domain
MKTNILKLFKPSKRKKKASKIEDVKKRPVFIKPFIKPSVYRVLFCTLLSAVIAVLIAPQLIVPKYNYRPGDISKQNIRAPQDFSVEDSESTGKRKTAKAESVLSVYDFNSRAEDELGKIIASAFSAMRENLEKLPKKKQKALPEKEKNKFQNLLKIRVKDRDFSLLYKRKFKKEIEDYLFDLTQPFAQRELVMSREQLFKERGRGIVLRNIYTKEEITVDDFSSLIDLKEAQILLKRNARKILGNVRTDVQRTIVNLALKLIEPTITFNKIETNARKTAAIQEVSPLYYNVKKGEIIVREGTKITDATLVKLKALTSLKRKKSVLWTLVGYFFLSFLSLHVLYRFSTTNLSTSSITRITQRDFIFLCTTFILTFLLIKFFAISAKVFSKGFTAIPLDSYFYAIPFAFAAIVISVVLSPQVAALSAIIVSMFFCFLLDSRFTFFIYSFISALVASQEVGQSRERKTIIRAGLIVGGANALLILSIYFITGDIFKIETLISIGFGLLGGILSAVLATGIIPIIEIMFNYTTDIKLLELADLNQPVLRKLLISAPGTYHHSILVGILSEAAAEAIVANPLLTRVSSYYHNIGKIKKPLYFVENQKGGENKHDKLLPSMSSLIIASHVKDGVEIAKQYRLGKIIQDIISQHHGTTCMSYFYQKAKDMHEGSNQPISDKNFRYPGPKPQTKEAGIVMLADAVQATSKTLSEPTPARIQGMVQRIINNIFADSQLDECELTLKNLHLIAENFIRILNGIFHARIEYPDKPEKEINGKDLDKKSAKTDTDRPSHDKANSERDLGRIGIKKSRNKHPATG